MTWPDSGRDPDDEPADNWCTGRVVSELVTEYRSLRDTVSELERAGSSQARDALHRLDAHDQRLNVVELKLEAAASARTAILRLVTILITLVMATVAILGALKK